MQDQPPMNPNLGQPISKPRKKMTLSSWLFFGMVLLGVVVLVCVGVWLFLTTKSSSDNGKTQLAAYQLLEPKGTEPALRTISSTLGVSVPYNATLQAGFGYADVITYSASDLDEPRPYMIIRVRPIETSEATRNAVTIDSPELRITTSLEKNFWENLQKDKKYADLSKSDALIKKTIDERTTDRRITASNAEAVTLGDNIQYKKVTFTTKDENNAVPTVSREDCYIAVQHDRPYVACINNIRPSNFASVPQLQNILADLGYTAPDEAVLTDSQTKDKNASMYGGKNDEKIDAPSKEEVEEAEPAEKPQQEQAKVPDYVAHSVDFAAVTKAIPATVRIGTVYCANLTLTLPDNSAGTHLTGACVDRASTGFFVSKDGLIATLANKVKVTPRQAVQAYISNTDGDSQTYDRLARMLEYLQKSRIIMQTDADDLTAGLQQRDRDAIDKINSLAEQISPDNITVDQEEYKYAIQLSDKPIVVNRTDNDSLEFAYSDTVFEATLEGVSYDDTKSTTQIFNGATPDKDMALLRIKKDSSYPTLQLAESSSLGKDTPVDIVGLPMYAFGTLEGGQLRSTTLLRQGKTDQSFNVSAGQRLQSITTASHAGLSGAPALNQAGKVVGIATYNEANCPDNKCFDAMLLRDPAPILSIAKQRNISLQSVSVVSDVWNQAVDEYVRGNYEKATELFSQSAQLYPQNYLAPQFAALAKSQIGSATDTSGVNTAINVMKIVILISLIILVLLIIARLFIKVFSQPHYNTQYGQLANGEYIDAKQWKQGGGYATNQPVTQPPTYVPTQPQPQQPTMNQQMPPAQQTSQAPIYQQTPPAAPPQAPSGQVQTPPSYAPEQPNIPPPTFPPQQ